MNRIGLEVAAVGVARMLWRPVLVQLPHIRPIQKACLEDHFVPAGIARQGGL